MYVQKEFMKQIFVEDSYVFYYQVLFFCIIGYSRPEWMVFRNMMGLGGQPLEY